jgi:hypothetical protein
VANQSRILIETCTHPFAEVVDKFTAWCVIRDVVETQVEPLEKARAVGTNVAQVSSDGRFVTVLRARVSGLGDVGSRSETWVPRQNAIDDAPDFMTVVALPGR